MLNNFADVPEPLIYAFLFFSITSFVVTGFGMYIVYRLIKM